MNVVKCCDNNHPSFEEILKNPLQNFLNYIFDTGTSELVIIRSQHGYTYKGIWIEFSDLSCLGPLHKLNDVLIIIKIHIRKLSDPKNKHLQFLDFI